MSEANTVCKSNVMSDHQYLSFLDSIRRLIPFELPFTGTSSGVPGVSGAHTSRKRALTSVDGEVVIDSRPGKRRRMAKNGSGGVLERVWRWVGGLAGHESEERSCERGEEEKGTEMWTMLPQKQEFYGIRRRGYGFDADGSGEREVDLSLSTSSNPVLPQQPLQFPAFTTNVQPIFEFDQLPFVGFGHTTSGRPHTPPNSHPQKSSWAAYTPMNLPPTPNSDTHSMTFSSPIQLTPSTNFTTTTTTVRRKPRRPVLTHHRARPAVQITPPRNNSSAGGGGFVFKERERKEEKQLGRMDEQIRRLIREGKEALGTKVDVNVLEEDEEEEWL
ncbi:hypothetical protein SAICODRAFT_72459 [Saitoella complicata NRRL Y-17804]|uniref:Uncharacterized protein n=1 Tax=Saitoella complicata (strain BCRC 22490 / CBS 7301 / JCM 7358 / NBRC 10748 / NRRL Y-17804) TaxID=698492 RepID=A0A0E9NBZ5_SAICN|nr:uncharacterized protein SAICODRAFT_72459 [Saitoella complicata NRRL Y-17804]ODQ51495.1 hypothetical protein SAICODRAFT_72459 [Saitoella complicata NRRL Y-17804]GAO47241.1 hypothetical protein G7K_1451-t1 [Saitoella complicata NRRL Y-17804]